MNLIQKDYKKYILQYKWQCYASVHSELLVRRPYKALNSLISLIKHFNTKLSQTSFLKTHYLDDVMLLTFGNHYSNYNIISRLLFQIRGRILTGNIRMRQS